MLRIEALHAFYGKSHVLQGVTLQVRPGEIVALLGRNGSGRSTTLKAVIGLVAAQGRVTWNALSLLGRTPFDMARRGVGYVSETRDIFPTLTVQQNLLLGEQRARRPPGGARWRCDDVYAMFPPLYERRRHAAGVLSGGEQQMLALGRTLMGEPGVLLLDEPTEGLAPQMADRVAQQLLQLQRGGMAILLVEQKLALALEISQRCCVLGHGSVVFDDTPAQLRDNAYIRQEWLEV